MLRREHVTAGQQLPQLFQIIKPALDHLVKQARRQPEHSDPLLSDDLAQLFQRSLLVWKHDEASAVEQASPNLERGRVKRDRRELQETLFGVEVGVVGLLDQAHDVAMCDSRFLWAFRLSPEVNIT